MEQRRKLDSREIPADIIAAIGGRALLRWKPDWRKSQNGNGLTGSITRANPTTGDDHTVAKAERSAVGSKMCLCWRGNNFVENVRVKRSTSGLLHIAIQHPSGLRRPARKTNKEST